MGMNKSVRIAIAIVLTLAYAWIAVHVVDVGSIRSRMRTAIVPDLELGVACLFLMLLMRGMRVAVFIGKPRSVVVWMLAILHSGLNALLPAKLGELSLPILLRRFTGMSGYGGATVLVLLRLHDLLAMLVVSGALAATFLHGPARVAALACVAAALAGQVLLVVSGSRIMHAFMLLLPVRWRRWRFLCKLQDAFQSVDRSASLGAAVVSLGLWTMLALGFHFISEAAHGPMSFGLLGLAMGGSSLAFAVPAGGIANVGPFEAAWTWILHTAGWTVPDAVASALFVHGCALLCSVSAGLLCMMVLSMVRGGGAAKGDAVTDGSDQP